jgi:ferric-dicitrate binding protein FerR (iron transport regulator)
MGGLIAVLILGLTAGTAFAAGSAETVSGTASVSYLEGQVSVDRKSAAIGDPVPLGSTVVTDAQSLCEIQFNVKNVVRLAEATTFVFDPGNLQKGSELKNGAVMLVLKKLAAVTGGAGFTVRTGNAVAGVRGTSFFFKAVDPVTTYICCCNGAVHMENATGSSSQDVEAPHHKAYLFTSSGREVTVSDSTLLYHTDADMEGVAATLGVTIDWSVPDR